MRRATKLIGQNYCVKHNFEIIFVELVENFLGIRKDTGIPCERSVFCIPSRRTESGAQVNKSVTGQLLFTEGSAFRQHLLSAGQRAMRLLVTEAPQRRQFRMAREPQVFRHDGRGLTRTYKEDIQGQCIFWRGRLKCAFSSGEIERAEWLMNKHRPARSANDPRDRHTAAVRCQFVATLAASHFVIRTTTIELRAALAQPEKRRVPGHEGNTSLPGINL